MTPGKHPRAEIGVAGPAESIPRRWWVGALACVFYVVMAAVLARGLEPIAGGDDLADYVLSHYIPLPLAILAGLLFIRRAGWSSSVWRETPTPQVRPRRWWLLSIPLLLLVQAGSSFFTVDWPRIGVAFVLIALGATVLVGFGEELYFRGILVVSLRGRHGELLTLLVSSALFGLGHAVGSIWAGTDPVVILFQVSAIAMTGSLYFWVRRVTGTLWMPIALHALSDLGLYLNAGPVDPSAAVGRPSDVMSNAVPAVTQILLIIASVAGIISAAREDQRTRRQRLAASNASPHGG